MAPPTRYEMTVDGGTLYVERDDGPFEVGPMDAVVELLGGETYTLQYTDEQAAAAWLDTDADGTITVDVRERVPELTFTDDFVGRLASTPLDENGDEDHPLRTEVFADHVRRILDTKGNLEG